MLFTVRIGNVLTPWRIEVDAKLKRISIKKRNWYLISVDENAFNFGTVRNIEVDKHLFGADLTIKAMGGQLLKGFAPQPKKYNKEDIIYEFNRYFNNVKFRADINKFDNEQFKLISNKIDSLIK